MSAKETARDIGIRLGRVVKRIEWIMTGRPGRGELVEHVNRITLSAGDAKWPDPARFVALAE